MMMNQHRYLKALICGKAIIQSYQNPRQHQLINRKQQQMPKQCQQQVPSQQQDRQSSQNSNSSLNKAMIEDDNDTQFDLTHLLRSATPQIAFRKRRHYANNLQQGGDNKNERGLKKSSVNQSQNSNHPRQINCQANSNLVLESTDALDQARIEESSSSIFLISSTPLSKAVRNKGLHHENKKNAFDAVQSLKSGKKLAKQESTFNFQQSLKQIIKQSTEKQHYCQLMTPAVGKEREDDLNQKLDSQQRRLRRLYERTRTMTAKVRLRNNCKLYEDVCPICLCRYSYPKARLPCKHEYCYECVDEWIKNSTVCPCCRQAFEQVTKVSDSKQQQQIPIKVQKKEFVFDATDHYVCYVCGRGDNQEVLLLCDDCDFYSCHIYCDERLDNTIPEGDWFCKYCCQRAGIQPHLFTTQHSDANQTSQQQIQFRFPRVRHSYEQSQSLDYKTDESQNQPVSRRTRSRILRPRANNPNNNERQSIQNRYLTLLHNPTVLQLSVERLRRMRRLRRERDVQQIENDFYRVTQVSEANEE